LVPGQAVVVDLLELLVLLAAEVPEEEEEESILRHSLRSCFQTSCLFMLVSGVPVEPLAPKGLMGSCHM
jgi:hypothetical protein